LLVECPLHDLPNLEVVIDDHQLHPSP
jgi:hypothetical protein